MAEKLRVLAVGAHPDDIEILCAGTLAKYAAQGHQVTMAYATNGEMGHMLIQPPELAQIREKEARNSAAVIGAEVIWLGYPDEFIYHDHDTRMRFIDMIREAKPDVVITHNPQDYHEDHRIVNDLIFVSSFLGTVPNIKTEHDAHTKIPPVYYMDSLAGVNFLPTEYVDISEVMEKKAAMLACHESQVKWLKDHDNIDIIDFMKTLDKFRGLQCGVDYAEGFRKLDAWPRQLTQRVLP